MLRHRQSANPLVGCMEHNPSNLCWRCAEYGMFLLIKNYSISAYPICKEVYHQQQPPQILACPSYLWHYGPRKHLFLSLTSFSIQADLAQVSAAGNGKVDVTVGSALDIFGGELKYSDVVKWHNSNSLRAARES